MAACHVWNCRRECSPLPRRQGPPTWEEWIERSAGSPHVPVHAADARIGRCSPLEEKICLGGL
jgi:hypothetical protein